jgi:hypothetical protein
MSPLISFLVSRPQRWLGWLAAGCCLFALLAPAADAAVDPKAAPGKADAGGPAKTPVKPVIPTNFEFPKFVFVDDIKVGKDPFFPKSARREPVKPVVTTTQVVTPGGEPAPPPPPPPKPKASSFLTLKGILGTKAKRLAMISTPTDSYEFVGNRAETVTTPEGVVKVRCVEFKRESVIISVDGEAEPVELKLTDK